MGGRTWTERDNTRLVGMWSIDPVWRIAHLLGRSETAVALQALRLGLKSIDSNPRFLNKSQLADAMGIAKRTAYLMMRDGRLNHLVVVMYRCNQETAVISLSNLVHWVGDPENWYAFDSEKVQHPDLVRAVNNAKRWWSDEWWTVQKACQELNVCEDWLCVRLRGGLIRGRRVGPFWRVLRSDIMRVKKEMKAQLFWLRSACDVANLERFSSTETNIL